MLRQAGCHQLMQIPSLIDMPERPKIVCLCGSTKFVDAFDREMMRLSLEGCIVLTIGTHNPTLAREQADNIYGKKAELDVLHFRKIDLADSIFVLNVGGYIGKSTSREIMYAAEQCKDIVYLEEDVRGS